MIVYAESSAVLALLLGEPGAEGAGEALRDAERVVASVLTGIECARAIRRHRAAGAIDLRDELALLRLLSEVEQGWDVVGVSRAVADRAAARFPVEPVRTLDALHVATAAVLQERIGQIVMLSRDDRVRTNAAALGLDLLPA
ncbi:MAG: PIN domain-containing protein [Gemmatimonadales bacterium]|nr:PIN domain-containing protein [Gemmatimonadales bacterium]